ncbi:hypothetical protein DNHGIG_22980 [Collibacillus ludicampi]|jgi:hypothetical protein|uniref:Uncharacterized protein n=1 Tax=Collibacillus ludicampi TaxID=2771369 RepID=A0AAV4LGV3_9BACL|nr:hypothetical protein [Collibacillus ludicampi]GIM46749.1 hypothetical protein DNHGIG_22980 [Collibacillus ludicampi]
MRNRDQSCGTMIVEGTRVAYICGSPEFLQELSKCDVLYLLRTDEQPVSYLEPGSNRLTLAQCVQRGGIALEITDQIRQQCMESVRLNN